VTHMLFAAITTAYILVAIQFEERDLMAVHPEYGEYRKQVPMIVPGLPKRVEIIHEETQDHAAGSGQSESTAARLAGLWR
jgi:hypothetical protein